jgi:hypothetical protein
MKCEAYKMSFLPWPDSETKLRNYLKPIDEKMLNCTESFIRRQVQSPVKDLLKNTVFKLDTPQAKWFDIYSIFNSNQQLNEACNKLWAGLEIMHMTDPKIWKINYTPIGSKFDGSFILGTAIPTIYYSQLSLIVANLSIFGTVPIMLNHKRYFMVRTDEGWKIFSRGEYASNKLGINTQSWHEVILKTFQSLRDDKKVALCKIDLDKTFNLKNLRNEMHYEILGDLRMWRAYTKRKSFYKVVPLVIDSMSKTICAISSIKKITTGADERFEDLKKNFHDYLMSR